MKNRLLFGTAIILGLLAVGNGCHRPTLTVQDSHAATWMEVDNGDEALLPGMHAKLTITLGRSEKEVIAVPLRALLSIGSRSYAFVEQGQEFKRVEVKLGRRDAHYAEVSRGLFPGDRVVVSGVNEMNNALSAVR